MFREVGYLYNGTRQPGSRPVKTMTLYRGAAAEYARGMSWTDSISAAGHFAEHTRGGTGAVYSVDAPPAWHLARVSPLLAIGSEFVLDVPVDAPVHRLDPEMAPDEWITP